MPSAIVGKVHVWLVEVATKVQVTVDPEAGVAVKVTVAPTVNPPIFISGVLSFVILSEFEVPVSEAVARVGAAGAARALIAMVRVIAANIGVSDLPPNSNKGVAVPEFAKSSNHSPLAYAIFEIAEAVFFGEFDA